MLLQAEVPPTYGLNTPFTTSWYNPLLSFQRQARHRVQSDGVREPGPPTPRVHHQLRGGPRDAGVHDEPQVGLHQAQGGEVRGGEVEQVLAGQLPAQDGSELNLRLTVVNIQSINFLWNVFSAVGLVGLLWEKWEDSPHACLIKGELSGIFLWLVSWH